MGLTTRTWGFWGLLAALFSGAFGASQSLADPAPGAWKEIQRAVVAQIREAGEAYKKGDVIAAKKILSDAYFEKFEAYGMEMVVKKHIASSRAYQLERMFGNIRKSMTADDRSGVDKAIGELADALREDAATLDNKNIQVEGAGYVAAPKAVSALPPIGDRQQTQTPVAEGSSPRKVAGEIKENLEKALTVYRGGDTHKAKGMVSDAYFDLFEGKGLEAMIAARSSRLKAELESKFGDILGLIDKGAPESRVELAVRELTAQLLDAADDLGEGGGWFNLFIASFSIIAREGFEAILILSAIIAYLRRTGNDGKVGIIGAGAFLAVIVSAVTAAVLMNLYTQSAAEREILEGVTMLIASAVLFYVSYWLISKAESAKWMDYIKKQAQKSIGKGSALALGFTAFIVVYREGAETVLFYSALFANSGSGAAAPIWAGFLAGSAALLAVYQAFKYGSAKIPIRSFFNVTSAILLYMAFVFAGEGVVELQVGGLISSTPLGWAPRFALLGIHPTLESLLAQGAFIMTALCVFTYIHALPPFRNKAERVSARKSEG